MKPLGLGHERLFEGKPTGTGGEEVSGGRTMAWGGVPKDTKALGQKVVRWQISTTGPTPLRPQPLGPPRPLRSSVGAERRMRKWLVWVAGNSPSRSQMTSLPPVTKARATQPRELAPKASCKARAGTGGRSACCPDSCPFGVL